MKKFSQGECSLFLINNRENKALEMQQKLMVLVSRHTIYDWLKHGKLKPYKVRSRLYFLWNDIQDMLQTEIFFVSKFAIYFSIRLESKYLFKDLLLFV